MRKIEKDLLRAIKNGDTFNSANTRIGADGMVRLHNNPIIDLNDRSFCMCGWGSATTRSRLNAVLPYLWADYFDDVGVSQRDYEQYLHVLTYDGASHTLLVDTKDWITPLDVMEEVEARGQGRGQDA